MLGNILVLNREILTNSTPTTYSNSIFYRNNSEVFILVFLYKSNSSNICMNNTSIKLEIIIKSKEFTLLSQELSLIKL
jgi:hypothetical protein